MPRKYIDSLPHSEERTKRRNKVGRRDDMRHTPTSEGGAKHGYLGDGRSDVDAATTNVKLELHPLFTSFRFQQIAGGGGDK